MFPVYLQHKYHHIPITILPLPHKTLPIHWEAKLHPLMVTPDTRFHHQLVIPDIRLRPRLVILVIRLHPQLVTQATSSLRLHLVTRVTKLHPILVIPSGQLSSPK